MGKFEDLSPKARDLYVSGMSQKEISQSISVSETTLVEWKKRYEGTDWDWDMLREKATKEKKSVKSWLEDQIQQTMGLIEKDPKDEDLLNRLNKFIVMNKNYDGSIDKLGETHRVMSAFASFVRKEFPHDVDLVKEITTAFMRYMVNK